MSKITVGTLFEHIVVFCLGSIQHMQTRNAVEGTRRQIEKKGKKKSVANTHLFS